jgi:cyclohexanecarboxylate-CoA ligase
VKFDPVLLQSRRSRAVSDGLWRDLTINDYLDRAVADRPDKLAVAALSTETGVVERISYGKMAVLADRIAVGLFRLGIGPSDVVSVQLPNVWEFTLTYLACARIGAVINPLTPILRERELVFMMRRSQSKLLVIPTTYRGFDYVRMVEGIRPDLPDLSRVVCVGGHDEESSFDALLTGRDWEADADAKDILARSRPGPDEIMEVIYTSGTTGEPKGVMHSANTTLANVVAYARRAGLDADDVVWMASPVTHQTGFLYGVMMPIVLQASSALQDAWDAKQAVRFIRQQEATFTMAATPFLADLAKVVQETGVSIPSLRTFACGGASIPTPMVEHASKVLKTNVVTGWGLTENGAVCLTDPDDGQGRALRTAGYPLAGVEVRVMGQDGVPKARNTPGKLQVRAASNFGGYLHRPDLNDTDAEGWFNTGDLGEIDDDGYVVITGRAKDIIIRGGENIPVVEIETLLYQHPAVSQVAIVAYPDERLGERGCAVIALNRGHTISLPEVVEFLKSKRVAVQYIPERLLIVDEMPVTASGKIQKFQLRDAVRKLVST